MPLVRIDTPPGLTSANRTAISDAVYEAMTTTLGVPSGDRFMIFTSQPDGRVYDRSYLGIARTDATIFVNILLRSGRTVAQKRSFYAELARLLQERTGLAPSDLFIALSENESEDWSFGNGLAQYVPGETQPVS